MHELQEKLLKLASKRDLGVLSLRKIGELVGENHPENIRHHLSQLEKKGFIKLDRDSRVAGKIEKGKIPDTNLIAVPIVGAANCGEANIFADENIEGFLKVSPRIIKNKKKVFAVRATGSSMNKAEINGDSIEDGDLVIVDCEKTDPESGDYVLSNIEGMANIKRFYSDPQKKQIVLVSESTRDYPPIYIHENDAPNYLVNGTVLQVIKNPKF